MATVFPATYSIALKIKFVCSNLSFDSSYHTGNILHKNLESRNNVTIIKLNNDLVLFVQFKNVKNTHGRVLLLVKLLVNFNTTVK